MLISISTDLFGLPIKFNSLLMKTSSEQLTLAQVFGTLGVSNQVDCKIHGTKIHDHDTNPSNIFPPSFRINGTVMAPFDIEYFIMLNNAIESTSYFDDNFIDEPNPKPW